MANKSNDTPAYITYTPDGGTEVELRFHAVMAEEHAASSTITKFPVQTGFEISNNSIRRNRVVKITGVISNTILDGTTNDYMYSDTNNTKTVFETLEGLVNFAQRCTVTTNLGEYYPVVFTSFNTKQLPGMIDAMQFTIAGDEIQLADTVTGSAPKLLSFSILKGVEKDNRIIELKAAGISACPNAVVSEASLTIGQDFIIEGLDTAGNPVTSTYLATAQDAATGTTCYNMHTSATDLFEDTSNLTQEALGEPGVLSSIASGFQDAGNCIVDAAIETGVEAATDFLETEVGKLKQSLYGALYSTMGITDNEYGQELIHAGVGCIVRAGTGVTSQFPYQPGEALPSVDSIMDSTADYVGGLAGIDINKATNGLLGTPISTDALGIPVGIDVNKTTNGLIGTPTKLTKIEGC